MKAKIICEITLKALLEKAGVPVTAISARSHSLHLLLLDLGKCKVLIEIGSARRWVAATRIRGVVVDNRYANSTVGSLLEAEAKGASKYPNQIRYGDNICHFPPAMMLKAATRSQEWARKHWDTIRVN